MARFVPRVQLVLVEYTFHNVLDAEAQRLPGRVESAVESLVGRERLPSDENVRNFIEENSGDGETAEQEGTQGARAPGTPLGALFRGASGAAGASDDRAQLREDGESEAPSTEDRSLRRRVSHYLRDDPDDGNDPHEDGFDQPSVSVAQRVREQDPDRVAASHERSHRLSAVGREEPTHRLSFRGPRGEFTREFEDAWGPRIHAGFTEAVIAFTRSDFGISLIWQ